MTSEIIIILVLAFLLYILLRHWPETLEATKFQQLNVRKPHAEKEKKNKPTKDINYWQSLIKFFKNISSTIVSAFGLNGKKEDIPLNEKETDEKVIDSVRPQKEKESSEFEDMLLKADMAQRKGSYDIAEKHLIKAATIEPKNPKVYSKIGILYLEQGENWEEAEQSFRQAQKYDPDNGFIHNNLGLVLYHQDKFSAAKKEFEKAVSVDSSIPSRHVNLGLTYMSLRLFAKAESSYKKAMKLDSGNEEYQDLVKEAGEKKKAHMR